MSKQQNHDPFVVCAFLLPKSCNRLFHKIHPTYILFAPQVLAELKEYATEVDVDFVRKAVRAIGRCAIKVEVSRFWESILSQGWGRLLKTESSLILAVIHDLGNARSPAASQVPTMQITLAFSL